MVAIRPTSRRGGEERYTRVAIAFHWTIAAFVLFNLLVGIGKEAVPALGGFMAVHKALGLSVLVLTLARVAWRLAHRPPPLPASVPGWQKGVAHLTHWGLYALLLAMPLSGWIMVSGPEGRRPLTFFGLFDLPYLPATEAASGVGHDAHGVLGWLTVALVATHVGAALYHHFALRDGVLARMAPALRR